MNHKILVPTSGYLAAKERSDYIIQVAKRLSAEVHVVHIRDPKFIIATSKESEAWEGLRIFQEKGQKEGISVSSHFVTGELVPTLISFARDNDFDMILIGASSGGLIAPWILQELLGQCDVPVLVVPQDLSALAEHIKI
jgi:nucleotide-binding universal stress UspA family protein